MLGIKTESQAGQPAYYVPEYLHAKGVDIIPVPGSNQHILGFNAALPRLARVGARCYGSPYKPVQY